MRKIYQKIVLTTSFSLLLVLILVTQSLAAANVQIIKSELPQFKLLDQTKITSLVTKTFNLDSINSPYNLAKVKPIYAGQKNLPDYLIVYLMYKDYFIFETYKLELNHEYTAKQVTTNYLETDLDQNVSTRNNYPIQNYADNEIEAVFATCNTEIETAVNAVKTSAKLAENAGYKVKVLIGQEANIKNYQYWMQHPNLKIFANIGHGSNSGIMLADGALKYTWFNSLSKNALKNRVFFFNSCQVHNNPLEGAILSAGVQKYIGGDINLIVGVAKNVFLKFWELTIKDGKKISVSIREAVKTTNYPDPNAYGISGNGADYLGKPKNPKSLPASSTTFNFNPLLDLCCNS